MRSKEHRAAAVALIVWAHQLSLVFKRCLFNVIPLYLILYIVLLQKNNKVSVLHLSNDIPVITFWYFNLNSSVYDLQHLNISVLWCCRGHYTPGNCWRKNLPRAVGQISCLAWRWHQMKAVTGTGPPNCSGLFPVLLNYSQPLHRFWCEKENDRTALTVNKFILSSAFTAGIQGIQTRRLCLWASCRHQKRSPPEKQFDIVSVSCAKVH